ncbi:hypothetical protein [Sphingobium sp. EM0848]|uniref:hypothetical protein n=1 Tax=Sphingobium sp. EM0848 TaxID=2743473 RepID=UPI00159C3FD0|nr:hypothetical protein [Sphingobium sp. EM0848]
MRPAPYRNEAGRSRLFFILSLRLSLAVALLSALAPLGPPSSRFTGSAFNPATTSVVLKARAQAKPAVVRVTEPDGDGRASVLVSVPVWLMALAALMQGVALFGSSGRFSRSFPSFPAVHRFSRLGARAPPSLS